MLKRIKFYLILITFSLSFFLITFINQYIYNTDCRSDTENPTIIRNLKFHEKEKEILLRSKPTISYNNSSYTEYLLDITRRQIRRDLQSYNLSGISKLEDLTMETGGQPLRSLIISAWRSGSTFLGELLNSMPGNFYHYEPFSYYKIMQIRGPPVANKAIKTIRDMFKCTYEGMEDYFNYGRSYLDQFRHNARLWDHCKNNNELCFDANFTGRMCRLFPFHSMKVVRFRLRLVKEILDDKQLNVKVVLLIRDPRAVKQSRRYCNFCRPAPDCWEPKVICADMISDYVAAGRLMKQYPGKLMVLRYEDLALDLRSTTQKLLKFLGLSSTESINDFLNSHTNVEVAGVTSTYRITSEIPFKWKRVLDFAYVDEIQMACYEAMDLWGYRIAQNASHMSSVDFFPLESYTL